MELITKLENLVAGWTKSVPHLPAAGQKWLAHNVWWIVLIAAIATGIGILFAIGGLFTLIALLGAVSSSIYGYYAVSSVSGLNVLSAVVAIVLSVLSGILLAMAVKPLQSVQHKGWKILFVVWLVEVATVVINAILSFSVLGFILGIIFGGIFSAVTGYFIFEIRGQFAHSTKPAKTAKKAAA